MNILPFATILSKTMGTLVFLVLNGYPPGTFLR